METKDLDDQIETANGDTHILQRRRIYILILLALFASMGCVLEHLFKGQVGYTRISIQNTQETLNKTSIRVCGMQPLRRGMPGGYWVGTLE
jgi:hypothetical protein